MEENREERLSKVRVCPVWLELSGKGGHIERHEITEEVEG